tara:strand:+ start:261 stop:1040 length:780 start_codon:yes stop_codon:yes gene_type:complete
LTDIVKKIGKKVLSIITLVPSILPPVVLGKLIYYTAERKARALKPKEGLKFLFELDNSLYPLQGTLACAYDNGLHTKHRHTKYHDFFVEHVNPSERVLDVGCGNGALTYDIAKKVASGEVLGIDLNSENIAIADEKYSCQNVSYMIGDVLADGTLPTNHFDVVILSNVLEHLTERSNFLSMVWNKVNPKRILLRVPLFERDWRVPLKEELGIDWRLDPTHETEYTMESWSREIKDAGLTVTHQEIRWGEIWAEVVKDVS